MMVLNSLHGKEAILLRLREPGPESDALISSVLGLENRHWTRDFQLAESLVPRSAIYTLSHNDDRSFYWCDVSGGFHNVQGWGRTPACAVAAAGVAYTMDMHRREAETGAPATRPGTWTDFS